ncbi:MAG TPA: hypothetical protein VFD90_17175 [Gaiellales bacterium]|nr:hypothetical protein [Gaiellales bacterium]
MIRAAATALALAAALLLGAASAQAADECRGLQVCIPVAGPWVVIPSPARVSASATWQLVCPQGIVGGVDARASEAAVAVEFPGRIGSPVNPGITTAQSLLFKGTYAGRARKASSYRPFIGCIPGGGGGPRTPMSVARVSEVKPGQPITLRVKELRVTPGRLARMTLACRPGERLLHSAQSIGLFTAGAPSRAQLAAIHVVSARRKGQVLISATRRGLGPDVRAVVQVQVECAK